MLCVLVVLAVVAASAAAEKQCVQIHGYSGCAFFERAKCWGEELAKKDGFHVVTKGGTRDEYQQAQRRQERRAILFL